MVFPLFFLYNNNAAIQPPPKTAAEPAAEMQGEKMEICKISFDKRDFFRIIRQTDRQDKISLSSFPAYNQNFITPFQGTRCVHGHSVGGARPFAFWQLRRLGRGGVRSVYSHETRVALVKERVKEIERQRKRRVRSGALILAALAVGTALGAAAFCHRRGKERGIRIEK